MSSEVLIDAVDVGKCYTVYQRPFDRLAQMFWRTRKQLYKEFWALRGVNLQVRRGEVVGIIGRNGSGKSTLLQMLCGTLNPTEGSIDIRGKVAALLELGAGFNVEYTGRENVVVSAALMGLTETDVTERMDDILEFADIGAFVDQPVKTYSSGMFVRLAFAVQTAVQPDILVVDEALAVGDAPFQAKCYRRIAELVSRGTAVLFVSHDTGLIRELCDHAVWLHEGQLRLAGDVKTVTNAYTEFVHAAVRKDIAHHPSGGSVGAADPASGPPENWHALCTVDGNFTGPRWGEGGATLLGVDVYVDSRVHGAEVEHGTPAQIRIRARLDSAAAQHRGRFGLAFAFRNLRGVVVVADSTAWHADAPSELHEFNSGQLITASFGLPIGLMPGDYQVSIAAEWWQGTQVTYADFVESALFFKVRSAAPVLGLYRPPITLEMK